MSVCRCFRPATWCSAARAAPRGKPRGRLRHRDGHRARPHRRPLSAGQARGEPPGAPGPAGGLADRRRCAGDRDRLPAAGAIVAGLSSERCVVFAVGLLVGNVPEGLLPVITLALAVGVRELVHHGAVMKRLSAVETLGSTDVICTDKTGTLTENRMRDDGGLESGGAVDFGNATRGRRPPSALVELARAMADCNNARIDSDGPVGDPTEVAMLERPRRSVPRPSPARANGARRQFHFDPASSGCRPSTSGTARCGSTRRGLRRRSSPAARASPGDGGERPLDAEERRARRRQVEEYAGQGLRVLGVARRPPVGTRSRAARGGRAGADVPRAGRDGRPAAGRGGRGGRRAATPPASG